MSKPTVQSRIKRDKDRLLSTLIKIPIVQVACEKTGIGRATYYRWRKKDPGFALKADETIQKGKHFISDMAESQLINQIKDKNMTAIIFWLKYNHSDYGNRLEITAKTSDKKLTKEQLAQIEQAIKLGKLDNTKLIENNNEPK